MHAVANSKMKKIFLAMMFFALLVTVYHHAKNRTYENKLITIINGNEAEIRKLFSFFEKQMHERGLHFYAEDSIKNDIGNMRSVAHMEKYDFIKSFPVFASHGFVRSSLMSNGCIVIGEPRASFSRWNEIWHCKQNLTIGVYGDIVIHKKIGDSWYWVYVWF